VEVTIEKVVRMDGKRHPESD